MRWSNSKRDDIVHHSTSLLIYFMYTYYFKQYIIVYLTATKGGVIYLPPIVGRSPHWQRLAAPWVLQTINARICPKRLTWHTKLLYHSLCSHRWAVRRRRCAEHSDWSPGFLAIGCHDCFGCSLHHLYWPGTDKIKKCENCWVDGLSAKKSKG